MFKYINVTKQMMKVLPDIARKKNLKIEDVIKKEDFETKLEDNQDAITDVLQDELIKTPKNRKCYFIEGNRAYTDFSNETDYFLYVSVNDKKERFSLTLYHIFEIFKSRNHGIIETEMMKFYGFETVEEKDKKIYRGRYMNNLEVLESSNNWSKELSKALKSTIGIMQVLNNSGFTNVLNNKYQVDGEHIFFCSSRYIADKLKELDPIGNEKITSSKVTRVINFLATLGFIKKVDIKKVPLELLKHESCKNKDKININYFIIYEITDELLNRAEKIIEEITKKQKEIARTIDPLIKELQEEKKTLNEEDKSLNSEINRLNRKKARLTASNTSEDKIKQYFGIEKSNEIYKNIIEHKKEVIKRRIEEEQERLTNLIKNHIEEKEVIKKTKEEEQEGLINLLINLIKNHIEEKEEKEEIKRTKEEDLPF